mmetsp:Transcript_69230/g.225489  ORF Transcript_69230/g.225489 Transcript_69230/m.225489 type:complete len:393 (+) Transcript_69230:665-1843(+)
MLRRLFGFLTSTCLGRPRPSDAVQQPWGDPPELLGHEVGAAQEVHGGRRVEGDVPDADQRTACQLLAPDAFAAYRDDHGQGGAASPQPSPRHGPEHVRHDRREPPTHGGKVSVVAGQHRVEGLGQAEHRGGDTDLGIYVVVHPVPVNPVGDPLHEVVPDIATHRMAHNDSLLATHRDEHLDVLPKPREVAVPHLEVPEGQPPVVGGHVHRVVVVADVGKRLDHDAPEPVASHEEVRALEALGGPDADAPVEVRALERVKARGAVEREMASPAIGIAQQGLQHGSGTPDALAEITSDASLAVPNFQASGDDARNHHDRVMYLGSRLRHEDTDPLLLLTARAQRRDLHGAEDILHAQGRILHPPSEGRGLVVQHLSDHQSTVHETVHKLAQVLV